MSAQSVGIFIDNSISRRNLQNHIHVKAEYEQGLEEANCLPEEADTSEVTEKILAIIRPHLEAEKAGLYTGKYQTYVNTCP